MADRLRRSKDIIKKNLSNYLTTTTSSHYLKYFEGSPTYITFYQLDENDSTHDIGLESVNSFIGMNTPKRYKKINEVQVWGVDTLDVSNEISERGLLSSISGELLFLPNSIQPHANDYFSFEYEGLESHLFRITDVQFDKAAPSKYYRCQYMLSNENSDIIFQNVNGEYYMQYDSNSGSNTGEIKLVSSETAVNSENTKVFTDKLIDKYVKLFYDDDLDTFIYNSKDGKSYWSPYLQHFLHETKALSKYSQDLLTEIYIMDINEVDNSNVYSEEVYRNSIFRAVEIQDNELNFDNNFISISEYNLKMNRNLPFFMSPLDFRLVSPINSENNKFPYNNSIPLFFGDEKHLFKDVDHMHKVHILDDLHIARIEPYIKSGDILYECYEHELKPSKIVLAATVEEDRESYLELNDISITKLMKTDSEIVMKNMKYSEIFNIIKKYLNKELIISEEILDMLDRYYYKQDLAMYILIPLLVYILKETNS